MIKYDFRLSFDAHKTRTLTVYFIYSALDYAVI